MLHQYGCFDGFFYTNKQLLQLSNFFSLIGDSALDAGQGYHSSNQAQYTRKRRV